MTTFLVMLIPPGGLLLYAGWCYLSGRPLRKYDLNILSALLLLGYFLTTAGLGIFWVANQELPVFDRHYLFGYITLALILVHVGFNFKPIMLFLRREAPAIALSPDGRSWRPAIRTGGWALGLALFGAACFWMGLRRGSSRLEILPTQPSPPPFENPVAGGRRPLPRQLVKSDGKTIPLAEYYHEKTKHSRTSLMVKTGGLDWSTQPRVFKDYPPGPRLALPRKFLESATSTGAAIDSRRRKVLSLTPGKMSLREFSTLLHMTNGITAAKRYPGLTYYLRSAPSAGALYPTVTYVLVNQVEGVEPGLYHYGVKAHELRRLRGGSELVAELARACSSRHLVRNAGAVFLFSSIYFRSSWKYGQRAYRYCLMDAGHVAENLMLAAAALGYASVPIGRFDDRGVNRFLGLDDGKEGALLLVPVGQASTKAPPTEEPAFSARPRRLGGEVNPLFLLAHGQTYLGLAGGGAGVRLPARKLEDKPSGMPVIKLPREFPEGAALFPTIQRRRSARRWLRQGMTLKQLSSVLYYAFGLKNAKCDPAPDPSVEASHLLRVYIIVNAVQGLDPGVYYYRRLTHALSLIKKGDFRYRSYAIALFQEVVGNSGVAIVKTIDVKSLGYPDGDRGYRYATLDAGMIGGRFYLQTVALGLGCTGIGAFFDNEVSEVIGVDPGKELIIYMSAIGVKAPK